MHDVMQAIKTALEAVTALHIADINEIDMLKKSSLQNVSDILYLNIDAISLIEQSSAHATKEGIKWGKAYRVSYALMMRHENLLTSNTMTNLLDLGIAGTNNTIYRTGIAKGHNLYYVMILKCYCEVVYPVDSVAHPENMPINKVLVSINGFDPIILDKVDKNNQKRSKFPWKKPKPTP
jgi:hypothetical protein